jgi:hypothetical protein
MHVPRTLHCFAIVACLPIATTAESARAQDGSASALSYGVTVENQGSPWGEWLVTQGAEIAVARGVDSGESGGPGGPGDVLLVAGPAVGGLPSEPGEQGVLSTLFDPATGLGPGYGKGSIYGSGTAVVDSLRIELRKGGENETINGREARHHVLTARLWWRHLAEDGSETAVFETGTADLWFAPDLPFSWLPFAVHPMAPGLAFPLANSWPEVAWAAIAEYGERLEALGLLLRAQVHDEVRPAENPDATTRLGGGEYERAVRLSEIATAAEAPDAAPFSGLPRVSRARAAVLDMIFFLLEPCASLESVDAGVHQLLASSPEAEYLGGGPGALVLTDAGIEDSHVVVAGVVRDGGGECTVLVLPGADPRPGTFQIDAPNPGFAGPGVAEPGSDDSALGLYVQLDAQNQTINRVLVLESGQVRIDEAGPAGVSGRLEGRGWGLELNPNYPRRLHEGFDVVLTFEAVPATQSR